MCLLLSHPWETRGVGEAEKNLSLHKSLSNRHPHMDCWTEPFPLQGNLYQSFHTDGKRFLPKSGAEAGRTAIAGHSLPSANLIISEPFRKKSPAFPLKSGRPLSLSLTKPTTSTMPTWTTWKSCLTLKWIPGTGPTFSSPGFPNWIPLYGWQSMSRFTGGWSWIIIWKGCPKRKAAYHQ